VSNDGPGKSSDDNPDVEGATNTTSNEFIEEYKTNLSMYGKKKAGVPLKGSDRESFTLELLNKFKMKLHDVKDATDEDKIKESQSDDDVNDDNWYVNVIYNNLVMENESRKVAIGWNRIISQYR